MQICVFLYVVVMWPDRLNCFVVCIVLITARSFSLSLSRFCFLWDDDELWQPDVRVCLLCTPTCKGRKTGYSIRPLSHCVCPSLQFSNLFISIVPTNLSFLSDMSCQLSFFFSCPLNFLFSLPPLPFKEIMGGQLNREIQPNVPGSFPSYLSVFHTHCLGCK